LTVDIIAGQWVCR